ncbi:MAG: amino acid permease, partial [Clostridia bacterium]|nr:amino acid permease [Clostridia bacterium]
MENQLPKRYGLFTAICMVIGIVIGSGVFFKAQDILRYTGGNMLLGIAAWLIGGAVMVVCALNFAALAQKYEKVNGVVDYAEATLGGRFAYFLAWFLCTLYYPSMTAVLAWVSARYTLVLFGYADATGGLCLALAGLFLCASYAINTLSPTLTAKWQVSST